MSSSVGGRPVRSSVTRRSSVSRAASDEGRQPRRSTAASTKRSISLRAQPLVFTAGGAGFFGGMNDQCGFQSAPCSIQRTSVAFSTSFNARCDSGAGIITLGSVLVMRRTSSLLPGLPGTTARRPDASFPKAMSFTSRRRPALRCQSSGPWHLKQRSERIGLTWKLKSTWSGTPAGGGVLGRHAPLVNASASPTPIHAAAEKRTKRTVTIMTGRGTALPCPDTGSRPEASATLAPRRPR